jgi:hypothetical protein
MHEPVISIKSAVQVSVTSRKMIPPQIVAVKIVGHD